MFILYVLRIISRLLLVAGGLLFSKSIHAQKKWDGGGGDNQWVTAGNWSDNTVPVATDDILLDNSLLPGSYIVQLPVIAITISSITLSPAVPASIQLILPVTNTVIPAFSANGAGGIAIGNGGVVINSSGGSPGTAIVVTDSIRIYDGGRFIHNTSNGHASYVNRLSKAPGTERGVFEFNVPGGASYTISLSGRTYGSLELSAMAAGGTKSYLSNGITTALVRGDCIINNGVNYSLDFTGDLMVNGSLVNHGNFNLATGANNNNIKIRQQLICTGTITESSTGFPVIELNGNTNQDIQITGSLNNSLTLKMNNLAGATLVSAFSLPYKLELVSGKITTTASQLLSLQPNCTIQADSTSSNSFINGPLQKMGLSNTALFLFPVGKGLTQRWIAVKNASGNFTAEFFKGSAYSLSASLGIGIDHVSSIEYWSLDASSGASANVELSFEDVNSGGVTDVATLRVAQLSSGIWANAGNTGTTGSAGAAGSVISNTGTMFGPVAKYFTLSSSESSQNPLPVKWVSFSALYITEGVQFIWQISGDLHSAWFNIECSRDGQFFQTIKRIKASGSDHIYNYLTRNLSPGVQYYRIRVTSQDGNSSYSKIISLPGRQGTVHLTGISTTGVAGFYTLKMEASAKSPLLLYILSINGQLIKKIPLLLNEGTRQISLGVYGVPAGHYFVFGENSILRTNVLKFIKY